MLSPQAIQEFKEIYREEHHKELTNKEALELANQLINLFKIINKPMKGKNYESKTSEKE